MGTTRKCVNQVCGFLAISFLFGFSFDSEARRSRVPKISSQPVSVAIAEGQSAQFAVGVSNATTITYQWRKNGVNIAGATGSKLAFSAVKLSDAAAYSVDIIADTTHLVSNNAQLSVTVAPPSSAADGAWYDRNLHNVTLISLLKNIGADGSLSRSDMISVFDTMAALSTMDSTTLGDLRLLQSNGKSLGMPEYVINLADKTINYNSANARFQGLVLGNLAAGDAGSKLRTLMSKWFLGADTPEARNYDGSDTGGSSIYSYVNAAGSMDTGGIDITDIRQGNIANCYMHAAAGAVALRNAALLASNFIDNGDGSWTLRFFMGTVPDFVTVTRALPVDGANNFVFAGLGQSALSTSVGLWEALLEKGYAQINEEGWIGQSGMNSYQGLNFGSPTQALSHVSGHPVVSATLSESAIQNDLKLGKMMTMSSISTGAAAPIVSNHAYTLVNYDSASATYTLYNPWGSYVSGLSWAQLSANFSYYGSGN